MRARSCAACFSLLLSCVSACGRVGYELLPAEERAAWLEAGPEETEAGEPEWEFDAEPSDAEQPLDAQDAGTIDAGQPLEDAAQEDAAQADAGEGTRVDASLLDAAGTDASMFDAASTVDAGDAAAFDAAPATDASDGAVDASAAQGLILRYDFQGTGVTVSDRVGSAHGRILGGAQLDGSGALTLDGSNDYVDLPNGLISNLNSVTVVAWLVWNGGGCWQRVFDFGSSSGGEGSAGDATSSLALTTASCPENGVTGLMEYQGVLRAAPGTPLPINQRVQVALAVDGATSMMSVYADGVRVAQLSTPVQLSQLNDVNNWLGRSQWIQDLYLRARLDELRIYARALEASEVAALHARGPDAL
jgi:hypothetical protein